MSFTNVPVLDLSLARSADTKQDFLDQLRHALLEVGFLYLKNTGIPQELVQNVVEEGVKFFDIPMEEKCVLLPHFPSFGGIVSLHNFLQRLFPFPTNQSHDQDENSNGQRPVLPRLLPALR
jgi:isopenicillin N synthase-like dioxygenase